VQPFFFFPRNHRGFALEPGFDRLILDFVPKALLRENHADARKFISAGRFSGRKRPAAEADGRGISERRRVGGVA
jgi:hypothetical protein